MNKLWICPICYLNNENVISSTGTCNNCKNKTPILSHKYCRVCGEKLGKCYMCGQDIQHGNYYIEIIVEEIKKLMKKISDIELSEKNYKNELIDNKPNLLFYEYKKYKNKINEFEMMQNELENLNNDQVLKLMRSNINRKLFL